MIMVCDSQVLVTRSARGGQNLVESLRQPLERCFGADFGQVRFHVGGEAEALGTLAFAFGEHIFLAPHVWLGCPRQRLRVLAHELAHVVQQRQGRTGPWRFHGGLPIASNAVLEAEADAAAETVVRGGRVSWSHDALPTRHSIPVIQPLVSVNGDLVKLSRTTDESQRQVLVTNLSQRFMRTLNFIAGGMAWLDWAVNRTSKAYPVADELSLIQQMLEGLHNASLVRMPSVPLVLHPAKLWEMSATDFLALTADATSLSGDALAKLLSGYQLRPQDRLDAASQYFQNLAGSKPALWANLTLAEQIALEAVSLRINPDPTLTAQFSSMVAFATLKASDPRNFADCCWFYLAVRDSQAGPADPGLPDRVLPLWDEVRDLAVEYLDSPSFGPGWTGRGLRPLVSNWIEMGGGVGFQTASSAAVNIARYSAWLKGAGARSDTKEAITQYMNAARALIYSATPVPAGLTQDGLLRRFALQKGGQTAVLAVDASGTTTLESFVP